MDRNLGAKERPKDERDYDLDQILGSVAAPTRPDTYVPDLTGFQRNYQGQQPACSVHGGSHLLALLLYFANGQQTRKNPRYGWIELKDPASPLCDHYPIAEGSDLRSVFKWLQAGAPNFEPLENDVTLSLTDYASPTAITPAITADATAKIGPYAFGAIDFNSLCQQVWQSKAVALLVKVDDGFWGTTTPTFTTPTYGHFIVAYGYTPGGLWIVDSADPSDPMAFKFIATQYITSEFVFESGTAFLPPAPTPAAATIAPTVQNVTILTQIVNLYEQILSLLSPKVGSSSPQMINALKGKKTYILGICGLLFAITGFATGHLDSNTAIGLVFGSLGFMGLRNGVTTEVQNLASVFPDKTLPPQQ